MSSRVASSGTPRIECGEKSILFSSNNKIMDRGIPTSLCSGLGGVTGPTVLSIAEIRRLVSIVTTLIMRAMRSASEFASHSGRSTIDVNDVRIALRNECYNFVETQDDSSFEQDAIEVDDKLDSVLSDELGYERGFEELLESIDAVEHLTTPSDSDSGTDEDTVEAVDEAVITCSCEKCTKMIELDCSWDDWDPQDPVGKFLKEKTDESIAQFS